MHPLVRNLYKQVLVIGKDYPHPEGIEYVRRKWKEAIRNTKNWPLNHAALSCTSSENVPPITSAELEKEIRLAVGKGRYMVKEMIGIIQLKKYREMKKRYDDSTVR